MELDEIEIGVECKASLPCKPNSGFWALSECQWICQRILSKKAKCSELPLCNIVSVASWRMD